MSLESNHRRYLPACFAALLVALTLSACAAAVGPEQEVEAAELDQPLSLAPISNLCTTVLCPTGTICNPDTGSCDPGPGVVTLGQRCTISGDPPITTGCADGEVCRPTACTNSIPPNCFGTCVTAPKFPRK